MGLGGLDHIKESLSVSQKAAQDRDEWKAIVQQAKHGASNDPHSMMMKQQSINKKQNLLN
jgi:hypothetical protein